MKHYAIIPARAGSKSIVNKNLQKLGTRRLIDWTIEYATETKNFARVLISTDIPVILEEYKGLAFERNASLCTDDAVMSDVIMDSLEQLNGCLEDDDYIWLLQPTSPFRQWDDTMKILELLYLHTPHSLISVKDVGSNHPHRMYTIKNSRLYPIRYCNFDNKQALPPVFIRNGCYYVVKAGAFRKEKSFYLKPCIPYVMSDERSLNIDSMLDLVCAQAVAKAMRE